MAVLSPPAVSTAQFTWDPAERLFVAEASSLSLQLGPVYDDACDVGFTLREERTGATFVVAHEGAERDAEGDLLWTQFIPVDARGPLDDPPFEVRVYND